MSIKRFIENINKKDFAAAEDLLINKHEFIDKSFKDEEENTLMHLVFLKLQLKLYDVIAMREYKNWDNDCLADELRKHLKSCKSLIFAMLNYGFLFHEKNNSGKYPIEIFEETENEIYSRYLTEKGGNYFFANVWNDKTHVFRNFKSKIINKFEDRGHFLYSGRKYVNDLNLYRSSKKIQKITKIPDKWKEQNKSDNINITLHQRHALFHNYLAKSETNLKNIVIASISFLITSQPTEKIFITIPINDESWRNLRPETIKSDNGDFDELYPNPKAETHSEFGLIKYLHKKNSINKIITELERKLSKKPESYKIRAVSLDIHSTQELCRNCEENLYNLQNSYRENKKGAFLKVLEDKLNDKKYQLPKNEMLKIPFIIRASCLKPSSPRGNIRHNYPNNPRISNQYERDIKRHYKSVILHLPPKEYSSVMGKCIYQDPNTTTIKKSDKLSRKPAPNLKAVLSMFNNLKEGFFNIYRQTAFVSNTMEDRSWDNDFKPGNIGLPLSEQENLNILESALNL